MIPAQVIAAPRASRDESEIEMSPACHRILRRAICIAAGLLGIAPVVADYADVVLHDGTILRGDVEQQGGIVVLHTLVGDVRFPADRVIRILPIAASSALSAASAPATPTPTSTPAENAASEPASTGLTPPPKITPRDINRIRLGEMDVQGEPERVRVTFTRRDDQPLLEDVVSAEIAAMEAPDPRWRETLARGRPHEKLAVILAATGLKHADRIELRGETRVFDRFRKRVLPYVNKGCARAGCHIGPEARVFRLPDGSRASDSYAFVTFLILDSLRTRDGFLIDREFPAHSILAQFMLARDVAEVPHPEVERGRVAPVFHSRRDRRYEELIDWIASLRDQRPDYGLEYRLPEWATAEPAAAEASPNAEGATAGDGPE
ncbi:MAG: hypothetical protein D6744_14650 [Planctomycetota bacterium]|nr:MAG: hypothetical protein D6744_14650 [Planctomycetota bacterium]